MVGNRTRGASLFDLLARAWSFEAAVRRSVFNQDDSTVLYQLQSGRLALATTQDPESPKARTRIEADTGRTTIRQRRKPVAETIALPVESDIALPPVRSGTGGFLAIDTEGAIQQIRSDGHCAPWHVPGIEHRPALLSSSSDGACLAIAFDSRILVMRTSDNTVVTDMDTQRHVNCMAFSDTGDSLAIWGEDTLSLIDLNTTEPRPISIEGLGDITQICWSASGSHLACATDARHFWIVDVEAGTSQKIEGFPDQVSTVTFSNPGMALITSGAFRLAAWSTKDLPHDDQTGTPLSLGKAGFVVVKTAAAHPVRDLVAAGYADGLVTITRMGGTEEMMVHKENHAEVSTLTWSTTGEHLAIGFSSGLAAIVTFPDRLFK